MDTPGVQHQPSGTEDDVAPWVAGSQIAWDLIHAGQGRAPRRLRVLARQHDDDYNDNNDDGNGEPPTDPDASTPREWLDELEALPPIITSFVAADYGLIHTGQGRAPRRLRVSYLVRQQGDNYNNDFPPADPDASSTPREWLDEMEELPPITTSAVAADYGIDGYWNGGFGAVPASGEAIAALRETSAGEARERGCTVCLENFEAGEALRRMPCSHSFHERCIFDWLRVSGVCPLCRHRLSTEEGQQ